MSFFGIDIIAGALVAFAALPKVLDRIRTQRNEGIGCLDYGDLQRDALIIAGNLVWVYFGLLNDIYGLVIFGAINVILTGLLIAQALSGHFSRTS